MTGTRSVLVESGAAIEVDSTAKKLADRYRVPLEVIATLKPKRKLDADKLRKWYKRVAEAYRAANNTEYAKLMKVKERFALLGKLRGFDINATEDYVYLRLCFTTMCVTWRVERGKFEERDLEEWEEQLREWWWVEAQWISVKSEKRKRETRMLVAEKAKPVKVEIDYDAYRRLEEKLGRVNTLVALLGYDPEALAGTPVAVLVLTRALQAFAPEPIHAIELTVPGTGKTTTALKLEYALGWHYYNEPPSIASLVGDARTGRAIIAAARGLWFDEVDKWNKRAAKRDAIAEIIEVLLTGMEQGYWMRSKGGEKSIKTHNPIPVRFTGNIDRAVNPRDWLVYEFAETVGSGGARALEDRIGIAVTAAKPEYAHIIQRAAFEDLAIRAGVIRAAKEILADAYYNAYEKDVETGLKARKHRAALRVAAMLAAIANDGSKAGDWIDVAKKLVIGLEDPEELLSEIQSSRDSPDSP